MKEVETKRDPFIDARFVALLQQLSDQELADATLFIDIEINRRFDSAKQRAAVAVAEHTALHHVFGRSPL